MLDDSRPAMRGFAYLSRLARRRHRAPALVPRPLHCLPRLPRSMSDEEYDEDDYVTDEDEGE